MSSSLAALNWATANITAVEELCDKAATADAGGWPEGAFAPPTLADHTEREAESALLGCLQVRSGGLDPKTPSRTREWLWRGLLGGLYQPPVNGSSGTETGDDEDAGPEPDEPTELSETQPISQAET